MNWQCRLYGHQWRHPGEYEVILRDDGLTTYPFQCARCGAKMHLDNNWSRQPEMESTELWDAELGPKLEPESRTGGDTRQETEQS